MREDIEIRLESLKTELERLAQEAHKKLNGIEIEYEK